MKKFNVNVKSFISSLGIIALLMIICYVLSFILPGGTYTRTIDINGNEIIDTNIPFAYTEGGISFLKFILSPLLVLTMDGSALLIAIVIFLFVIGGIFKCLEESKIINYFLDKITYKYAQKRFRLLAILSLFFMLLGSLMGSAEEIIPLVPIMVAIAYSLGFDSLIGMSISMLAGSCGFAAGISNPFTIGVAHSIAGIPMFSGAWYRIIVFVLIYTLLLFFIFNYAKKNAKPVIEKTTFIMDSTLDKATNAFAITMGIGLVCIMLSSIITILQDYTMIITALMFLLGGIVACLVVKMPSSTFFKEFLAGCKEMIPVVIMILMASSIKYILVESSTLDTILHFLISNVEGLPKIAIILCIYLIFLIMEIFISSGSAKAFLLMPLVLPICQVFGISSRLAVLAFAFGDGFANVMYPTNAGLLIGLSFADLSFADWFKYSWKFFLANTVLTCGLLIVGLYIGY